MEYLYANFGVDSSSRFNVIAWTILKGTYTQYINY